MMGGSSFVLDLICEDRRDSEGRRDGNDISEKEKHVASRREGLSL